MAKAQKKQRKRQAKAAARPKGDQMVEMFHEEHPKAAANPAKDTEYKTITPEIVSNRDPSSNMGAPTKYDPSFCEALIQHMAKGLSFETFGAALPQEAPTKENPTPKRRHASRATMYEWEKQHADFSDAKKIGEVYCQLFWERLGIMGASGKYKGFNAAAYIFNKKNRFKWKDKHEVNVKGGNGDGSGQQKAVVILPSNGREVILNPVPLNEAGDEAGGEDDRD